MAETRLRYTGPIDGVALSIGDRELVVPRGGEIDFAEHLPAREAAARARELASNGDWTTVVHRETTKGSEPGGEK